MLFERFEGVFPRDHTASSEHILESHESDLACGENCKLQKSK
jgi:hypothetical protein